MKKTETDLGAKAEEQSMSERRASEAADERRVTGVTKEIKDDGAVFDEVVPDEEVTVISGEAVEKLRLPDQELQDVDVVKIR